MQTSKITELRKYAPSAAAALLFTALLAQAPHAATVFIRIAPQDVEWEVWWLAILGGVVYAIALESATAYFVWRNKMRWAIAFAAFSIMHNVAYYMPGAWSFDIAGATLSLRYIVSALLISASLPIAIAAFSHVHVESMARDKDLPEYSPAVPSEGTTAPQKRNRGYGSAVPTASANPDVTQQASEAASVSAVPNSADVPEQPQEDAKPAKLSPAQRQDIIIARGYKTTAEVMQAFGIKERAANGDLAEVRKALVQTNGTGAH